MTRILSCAALREADRRAGQEFGLSGPVLMEAAGLQAALWLESLGIQGPIRICAGLGNNGGDGFVMARHLASRGYQVDVLICGDPTRMVNETRTNFEIVRQWPLPWHVPADATAWQAALAESDWIVDALLGTGAKGAPRAEMATAIRAINAAQSKVLAVDVPSGLDADSGRAADPTVQAAYTVTFVALKPGFVTVPAPQCLGEVRVCELGIPTRLLDELSGRERPADTIS